MATADATRLVTPIPLRTWTGSAWTPAPVTGQATRLVIPAPIRRWNGTAWVTLYTPH